MSDAFERQQALIDALFDHVRHVRECGYEMDDMADAFRRTGNDRVACWLTEMAAGLNQSAKRVQDAYCQSSNAEYRETVSGVASILTTLVDRAK